MRIPRGGGVTGWGILRAVALLVVMAGCAAAPSVAPSSPLPVPQQNIVEPMPEPGPEDELLAWINASRNGAGLGPLVMEPRLYEAAIEFAKDSAERNYCGTRDSLGRGPAARARANGYDPLTYGEAVICGCTTPYRAVYGWLRNEAHREVVLDPRAVHAGIGWYVNGSRCYVVLDVGAERPPLLSPLPTPTRTPEPRRVYLLPVGN